MLALYEESRHFARHSSLIKVGIVLDRHFLEVTNRDGLVPSPTSVEFGIAHGAKPQILGRGGDDPGIMSAKGARPGKSLGCPAFVCKNCGKKPASERGE